MSEEKDLPPSSEKMSSKSKSQSKASSKGRPKAPDVSFVCEKCQKEF